MSPQRRGRRHFGQWRVGRRNLASCIGDRLIRATEPHRILDSAHAPLFAVKLNILRKTFGDFETDLDCRVFGKGGKIIDEAAGGGVHGYPSLEDTFLGGCLLSGQNAKRAAAKA